MKKKIYSVPSNDLRWEFFRCGGKGGQKQNKTDSGARVTHVPSGISCESREERQQIQNRRIALKRLSEHPRFVLWCKLHIAANLDGFESMASSIFLAMDERNLRIESSSDCIPGEAHCDVNDA